MRHDILLLDSFYMSDLFGENCKVKIPAGTLTDRNGHHMYKRAVTFSAKDLYLRQWVGSLFTRRIKFNRFACSFAESLDPKNSFEILNADLGTFRSALSACPAYRVEINTTLMHLLTGTSLFEGASMGHFKKYALDYCKQTFNIFEQNI